ncbi:O-antigen ligase family protein [Flavobacterium microcysteis]|nr:O-antigen ligase family protein [Flavobacterium microcysteis]
MFPILLGVLYVFDERVKINKILYYNLIAYGFLLILNFTTSLILGQLSGRFFEESLLILLPLLTIFIISGIQNFNLQKLINVVFYSYSVSYILYNLQEFLNISKLLANIILALRYSILPTESWLAFPMGLFCIYYIIEKEKVKSIIAIVLFVFAFKRISIFAFLLSLGVYFLFYVRKNRKFLKNKVVTYFMTLNVFLVTILYFFISGAFSKIIFKYTGLNVNHFTQGRFKIYNDTINNFKDDIWLGSSLGSTHTYIDRKFDNVSFLHSDILKVIIELGIFSFLIWIFTFLYLNITNKKTIPIILYLNILFLTDNVFIYFDTLFVFYLILIKFNKDEKNIDSSL